MAALVAILLSLLIPGPLRAGTPNAASDDRSEDRSAASFGGRVAPSALQFVENRGQWDHRALFRVELGDMRAWFTAEGIIYDLIGSEGRFALRQRFLGARAGAPIPGAATGARWSYLRSDGRPIASPGREEITYRDIYAGISLRFHGRESALKYDLIVEPGGRPSSIRMAYDGAEPEITPEGALRLATPLGAMVEERPYSYQVIGGARRTVPSRFERRGNAIGFSLGRYDRRYPVVIDPTLVYSSYLGGTRVDSARGIDLDARGGLYVAGVTRSENFPTTIGVVDPFGSSDIFVAKFDPTGRTLIWGMLIGGRGNDDPAGIRVSAAGIVTVAGTTTSADFPVTSRAIDATFEGASEGFVLSLTADGTRPRYVTYLGGGGEDHIDGFAIDSRDSVVVTGWTTSNNFPVTSRAYLVNKGGGDDAFVAKLGPNGDRISFGTYLGGDGDDHATAMALERGGAVYLTGWTTSSGTGIGAFPTTADAFSRTLRGGRDCFVARLRFNGEVLDYGTLIGGSGLDQPNAIAIDSAGGPYITGFTRSTNYPTTIVSDPGSGSWFITRFVWPATGALAYSRFVARNDNGWGATIQVDARGHAYVAGPTTSGAFPVTSDAFNGSVRGGVDIGLLHIDENGIDLHASVIGGSGSDVPWYGSVLSPFGDLFLAGVTTSNDFPLRRGAFDSLYDASGGAGRPSDAFFLRYNFQRRPAIYAPPRVTLPTLRCDTVERFSVWVYNVGDSELTITRSFLRNSDVHFSIDSIVPPIPVAEGEPFRIPPGDSIRFVIRYVSRNVGADSNELVIEGNDSLAGRSPLVIALGVLRAPPFLVASESSLQFDPVLLCEATPRQKKVTLTNAGLEGVELSSARLVSGGEGFSVVSAPLAVAKGTSADVTLRFLPVHGGTARDTLLIFYGPCGDSLAIPLSGRADTATISLGRSELRITGVPHCLTVLDTTVTVTNTGAVRVTVDSARFTGTRFTVGPSLPWDIEPGGHIQIPLHLEIPASGSASATLQLFGTPCAIRIDLPVSIERADRDSLLPSSPTLDFGAVAGCSSGPLGKDLQITIRNMGRGALALDPPSTAAPFSIENLASLPATLAPGAQVTLVIRFAPAANGSSAGELMIPYHGGPCFDTLRIPLAGRRENAVLVAIPSAIDFGRLEECTSARDTVILLENHSSVPIQVDQIKGIDGMTVRPTPPFTVAANGRDTVHLSFMPKQAGRTDGVLTFVTSPCGDSLDITIGAEKLGAVFTLGDEKITFRDRLVCELPGPFDTVAYLRGTGSPGVVAEIRSVEVTGGPFSIDPAVVGRTLTPRDALPVPIRFAPPAAGSYAGNAIVVLGPCNDTLRLRLEGRVAGVSLTVLGGNFESTPVDSADTASVTVVNTTPVPIDLQELSSLAAPFSLLDVSPALPRVLAPGETAVFTIRFGPGMAGTFVATPTARVIAPCAFDVIVPLAGIATGVDKPVTFCLQGTASGLAGDTVRVPIDGSAERDLTPAEDIEYLVRYDWRRLHFIGVTSKATTDVEMVAPGVLRVTERGVTRPGRGEIALDFQLLVGVDAETTLRLDSVLLGADRRPAALCSGGYVIAISNRCVIAGMKLGKYANLLENARPNPAGSVVEITYQQLEDARAVLTFHDLEGREVLRPLDQELPGGRYTVRVDVGDLASGSYFYSINAGGYRESRMMLIRH